MVRYLVAGIALAYLATLLYRAWSRAGGSRVFAVFAVAGLASAAEAVRFALGYGIAAHVGLSTVVDVIFLGAMVFPAAALVMALFGQVELARGARGHDQARLGRGRRLLFISALVAQPGLPGYTPRVLGIVAIVGLLSYEVFVAWRYLYAPKRSVPLMVVAAIGLSALTTALILVLGKNRVDALSVTLTVSGVLLCLMALLNFFSVFSTVAISGMALGVGVLTVVLSITSGFQQAFRDKVLGVNAHVIVMKYGIDFAEYEDVMERLAKVDGVVGLGPFYFNEMMVSKGVNRAGIIIKGVDPDRVGQVLDLPKLNVGVNSVTDAAKVLANGTPELQAAVASGEASVSAAASVADLPKKEQKKAVKEGVAKAAKKAKEKPKAESKVIQPTAVDAWDIPVQDHAAEAFAAVAKFKELVSVIQSAQRLFNEVANLPGGKFLTLPDVSSYRRGKKDATGEHADRFVHEGLERALNQVRNATPTHTVCPWHYVDAPHPKECRACMGLNWTPVLSDNVPESAKKRAKKELVKEVA